MSAATTFDLSKSRSQIGEDTIAAFLANDVEADLESVPGIGPANREVLQKAGYMTTAALLGLFLTLHDDEDSCQAHLDKFASKLKEIGINARRNNIVYCVARKADALIPGMFSLE